ncbi:hypothetical protein PR048_008085 [Dryococelus australis]|uniref:Uncharacterized protein n=1 Tax=Dryococelus australis TaxID=614101 RepID=A0ABQ9HXR9_9NEOP|nr:hypothetical protein PR048_008085 [Dryococelus australis]
MVVSSCDDLLAVRWNDNSVVTVLTNCDEVEPKEKYSRYSRTEKKISLWKFLARLPSIMPTWVVWFFVIILFPHAAVGSDRKSGGGHSMHGLLMCVVFRVGCYTVD